MISYEQTSKSWRIKSLSLISTRSTWKRSSVRSAAERRSSQSMILRLDHHDRPQINWRSKNKRRQSREKRKRKRPRKGRGKKTSGSNNFFKSSSKRSKRDQNSKGSKSKRCSRRRLSKPSNSQPNSISERLRPKSNLRSRSPYFRRLKLLNRLRRKPPYSLLQLKVASLLSIIMMKMTNRIAKSSVSQQRLRKKRAQLGKAVKVS